MVPFFDAGMHLALALTALYALLAAASLSVRLAARGAVPGMLSHQVNAWWRIFPVVTLALLAYPFGLAALAALICVLAFAELARHHPGSRLPYWCSAVTLALGAVCLGWLAPHVVRFAAPALIVLQALHCWRRPNPRQLVWLMTLIVTGAMLVLVAFTSLPFGAGANLAWLLYLFILTALNDIGQFVAGKLFGRHKIAPTISPNKTWQGLAGGIAVSLLVSLGLGSYLALAPFLTLAGFALVLSVAGFLGDLMFSAAKRRLAIKDFSSLIPGHGGILDRVDSLVLTAPLLYCLLRSVA